MSEDTPLNDDGSVDLDAALSASFDAIEADVIDTDPEPVGQPRGEDGKFMAASEEEEAEELADVDNSEGEEDGETPDTEEVTEEEATLQPPDSWTSEAKEMFSKADPALQEYLIRRDGEQQEGFAKVKSQYEEKASVADQFSELVRPYEAQMRAEGATPLQAVQTLLNAAHVLRVGTPQQKESLIRQTAQQFGVNLGENPSPEGDNSQIAALTNQVGELQRYIQNMEQGRQAEAEKGVESQIRDFAEAKENGEPKYPHFEAVRAAMGSLMASGQAKSMEDAYEMAVWANPETRKEVQDAITKADEAKRLEEAKKKATEAQKAKSPKSKGARTAAPKRTLDETLSDSYDKASSAA